MNRLASLDGLRALSVMAVVWHHTRPSDGTALLAGRGYLGVDVFFVISGFLITALLLREERERGKARLGRFWARRALRLFPLWYAILATLTVVLLWITPDAPMREAFFADLPWNATYTSNFIPGGTFLALSWSLATEEQFYVLWPLLLTRARAAAPAALLIAGGLSVGVHLGAFDPWLESWIGPRWTYYAALTATLLPLALGCGLALALHGRDRPSGWARSLAHPAAAPLALAAVVAAASSPLEEGTTRLVAQLAASVLVAACALGDDSAGWLRTRPLRWIGERSYGVYLLHMIVLQGVFALDLAPDGHRGPEIFALTLAGTLVAAGLSYRFLETPFLRMKERVR
ncbi:MAG: acyltransferase [Planctomycetota bacterium]